MAISCPNKSSQEWKDLVNKVGVNKAYELFYDNNMEIPNPASIPDSISGVNAGLKILNALGSEAGLKIYNRFFKGNKEKFYSELMPLAGKQQVEFLRTEIEVEGLEKYEDILTHITTEMSYTIEVKLAYNTNYLVYNEGRNYETSLLYPSNYDSPKPPKDWSIIDNDGKIIEYYDTEEEANQALKVMNETLNIPSSAYSDMTVRGGVHYEENEIITPAIIPSIKGHAQFSTDNGIGWFRSDTQTENKEATNTRRILELQSDLFQKGRDKEDLTQRKQEVYTERVKQDDILYNINYLKTYLDKINTAINNIENNTYKSEIEGNSYFIEVNTINYKKVFAGNTYNNSPINISKALEKLKNDKYKYESRIKEYELELQTLNKSLLSSNTSDNQFLQLLNKDNNWVTFFVKSIIQDSAKKGYEKVLFPNGNTASKIEGHTTLEEFKKQKEDRIKELEKNKEDRKLNTPKVLQQIIDTQEKLLKNNRTEKLLKDLEENKRKLTEPVDTSDLDNEISNLKQELERVETEGFAALKPIYNFYENTVNNILKKQGYNPVLITDEYGNTWNEVEITENSNEPIFFSTSPARRKEASKELNDVVKKFLESIGVTVQSVEEIIGRNGEVVDAVAVADMLYRTIKVVEGKATIDTLPEEASHFLVTLLRGTILYNSMFNDVQNYEIYKEVVREYGTIYNNDVTKLKEEAMAKIIASIMVDNFQDSKLQKRANTWWNRVIKFLKDLFSKGDKQELYSTIVYAAPFSEAADMIYKDLAYTSTAEAETVFSSPYRENDEFYQLAPKTQEEIIADITNNKGRGSISLEGERYVLTKPDGTKKEIDRRVSDRVKEANKHFLEPTAKEKETYAIRSAFGTKGHADLENVIKRIIAKREGTIVPAKTENLGKQMYEVLEQFGEEFVNQFPETSKIMVEVQLYDEKANEAGTFDVIVVHEDGTVDLFDWKFQEFKNKKDKTIANYKKNNWNIQLGRYVEILEKVYGIKKENIRKKRVIPIEAIYKNDTLSKIKVGAVEIDNFSAINQHLKPVPISSEVTGDERLDKLLEDLFLQKEELMAKKPSSIADETQRTIFVEKRKIRLEEIEKAITDIQLTHDIESYIARATRQIKDLVSTGIENLTLDELNEAQKSMEFYARNLIPTLGDIVQDKTKEYHEDLASLTANAQVFHAKLLNEIIRRTKDEHGEKIITPQKEVGWWERNMRTLSQQSHVVLNAFYKLVESARDKTRRELVSVRERLETTLQELRRFQESNGVASENVFDFMLETSGKNLRLKSKYSQEFYDQRDANIKLLREGTKEEQAKALRWFKENTVFDQERYDKAYEEYNKTSEKWFVNYENPLMAHAKARAQFADKYSNNIKGYSNKYNYFVKPADKHFSEDYKYIQNNKPLKDFYNLYVEMTANYRAILGQKYDARFVWNVKKDFVDSIGENGLEAFGDLKGILSDATQLQPGIRDGNIDPRTGEEMRSIPIYYLQGVETAKQSKDLGRILYLASAMTYNYKHMSEIEDSAKGLGTILQHSETIRTNNNGEEQYNAVTGKLQKIIGASSTIDQFKAYMNYYIYGVKNTTKDYKIKAFGREFSGLAVYNFISKAYVGKALAYNPISIIANAVGGVSNTLIIGAGNKFYSNADYTAAVGGLTSNDSKSYALVKFLDIIDGENHFKRANDLSVSALTKYMTYENLFIGQKMGDYAIRNSVALAMYRSHTLKNGKIVKKENKEDKSLFDMITIEDGKLKGTEEISDKELNAFRNKILAITENILGNNSRDDIRLVGLSLMGRALMMFRSWIPRTIDARYGELRYTEDIQGYELGRYRSFWNQVVGKQLIGNTLLSIVSFNKLGYGEDGLAKIRELYQEAREKDPSLELTEQEYIDIHIANMKANIMELYIVSAMTLLILAAAPDPDEDDEISSFRKYVIRQMDRNLSELLFYYSPTQFDRILKSPIPITRVGSDILNLFVDTTKEGIGTVIGDDVMKYEARPLKYGMKLFPVFNGIDSFLSIIDEDYDRDKEAGISSKGR